MLGAAGEFIASVPCSHNPVVHMQKMLDVCENSFALDRGTNLVSL